MLRHIFRHFFLFRRHSQVATTLTYISDFTVDLLYPNSTQNRKLPYLNTLPNYTLSYSNTQQYPILIHYQSIFS